MSNVAKAETVIVGGGLVGSLLALSLARKGEAVTVFERRPDMRKTTISAGRSINLAISERGLHALAQVGLQKEILQLTIPMRGRVIHPKSGELAFQRYGKDDSECIHSISRGELNKTLMTEAERTGRVRFQFETKAEAVDLHRRELSTNDGVTSRYERLYGTDGSASVVREAILREAQSEVNESFLDYGYKELHIAPGPGASFQLEKNALHIWPRGTFMLIALPNLDGSFTVTLFLPLEDKKDCPASFASLQTTVDVQRFFGEQFPDAVPLLENLTDTFFSNPTGRMVTVRCRPWNFEESALMLGDAAHAIVPFFGQGMNSGLEDVSLLMQDPVRRLGAFSAHRIPDANAIADLALDNFIEMRDKVGLPAFLLAKEVEKRLEATFSSEYLSRYRLVSFTRVPYRVALEVSSIQDQLLTELCAGIRTKDEVDLERAGRLIKERISPILAPALASQTEEKTRWI